MVVVRRVVAVYMLLLAAVVAGHFLANQFYDPGLEGAARTVWQIVNPLMVAGLVMVLLAAFARKRRLDADPAVDREYLEASWAGMCPILGWSHPSTEREAVGPITRYWGLAAGL